MSDDLGQSKIGHPALWASRAARYGIWITPIAAIVAAWWLYPDQDSLLHMAKPASTLRLPQDSAYYRYAWMPDNSVRFFGWEWPGGPVVRSFDRKTGRELWSRKVLGTDLRGMSPDGKWLLYDLGESYGSGMRKAVSLDGGPSKFWKGFRLEGVGGMIWKADGSEFIECATKAAGRVAVYSLRSDVPTVIDVPGLLGASPAWYDSTGTLVSHGTKIELFAIKPTTWYRSNPESSPISRRIEFPLPRDAVLTSASLSPSEKWVLWSFAFEESRPDWLRRLLTVFSRAEASISYYSGETVYVSKPNGSQMKEIGRVRVRKLSGGPHSFGWDRTGENICFINNRQLYRVPFRR